MFLEILDALMKEKGINKNILSKESGVPYTTIDGFYKKGCENIKLSTLQKLADYFGVTVDYLIGKTDKKQKSPSISDEDVKVALFGGDGEVTPEMWDDVRNYVEFVKMKYGKK